MNRYIGCLWIILITGAGISSGFGHLSAEQVQNTLTPKYLYKVLGLQNWKDSQSLNFVVLTNEDNGFIHLATEDQLSRITSKYWSNVPEYVILKIEANQLPGKLVFEANEPGGNKYYHLYDGAIPRASVLEVKIIKASQ